MFEKIPANARKDSEEDSGQCWKDFIERSNSFQRIFKKIPRNVREDFRECLKRFQGMLSKIPVNVQENLDLGNLNLDLFYEILLVFI